MANGAEEPKKACSAHLREHCVVRNHAACTFSSVETVIAHVPGTDHVVALLRSGALLSWGTGEQGQLGRIGARLPERGLKEMLLTPAEVTLKRAAKAAAADPITDIAAGNYSSFALTKSGRVWAWGLNNYGQLGQEGEVRHPSAKDLLEHKSIC